MTTPCVIVGHPANPSPIGTLERDRRRILEVITVANMQFLTIYVMLWKACLCILTDIYNRSVKQEGLKAEPYGEEIKTEALLSLAHSY